MCNNSSFFKLSNLHIPKKYIEISYCLQKNIIMAKCIVFLEKIYTVSVINREIIRYQKKTSLCMAKILMGVIIVFLNILYRLAFSKS